MGTARMQNKTTLGTRWGSTWKQKAGEQHSIRTVQSPRPSLNGFRTFRLASTFCAASRTWAVQEGLHLQRRVAVCRSGKYLLRCQPYMGGAERLAFADARSSLPYER